MGMRVFVRNNLEGSEASRTGKGKELRTDVV